MQSSVSIKRWLFDPALAAGLTILLASAVPLAAEVSTMPDGVRLEDSDDSPLRAGKPQRKPQHEARRHEREAKRESKREPGPAVGPFTIVVATARQQVTLYGQDGAIARAAVSTGVPDHPTPLGVFSVISKDKWHKSNIYSGAPMPYMQRITWSGIALHAGALPGYPASHGCIRLPEDFAVKLWGTTKVGARVIVTREAAAPVDIAHRNLFVPKKPEEKPVPVAAAAETIKAVSLSADPTGAIPPVAATPAADVTGSVAAVTPTEAKPVSEPPKRKGPVSVFVSRKQNRIFVRQELVPLFDLPVAIDAPERALGTHVFTAMALKDNGTAMRWSVITIPSGYRREADHAGKRGKNASHETPAAASTAAEALDRITLPPEAIEQISALLIPGSSLIVSDNALSDETDSDTDFIVLTQ